MQDTAKTLAGRSAEEFAIYALLESFPRTRESSEFYVMDSRFRGSDSLEEALMKVNVKPAEKFI